MLRSSNSINSSTEATPLFSSMMASSSITGNKNNNGNSSIVNSISQFAKSTFTKENVEAAAQFTREKAEELKKQAQDGDHSLRFLGVVAGLSCIVVGGLQLMSRILSLNIVGALIDCYIIVLGVIVLLLEGKNKLLSAKLVDSIHKYALFLSFLWGRGSLYFVIGTLLMYQFSILSLIAGGYMCVVGILYIIVGKRTADKLKTLRKFIYSEHSLRQKYDESNIEGAGLNMSQFKALCFNLGLDLTRKELEAAFGHLQSKSHSERLSYQDFLAWWNEEAAEQVDETSYDFL